MAYMSEWPAFRPNHLVLVLLPALKYTHINIYIHAYTLYIHTQYIYIHKHAYIHIHAYIYIHTCTYGAWWLSGRFGGSVVGSVPCVQKVAGSNPALATK